MRTEKEKVEIIRALGYEVKYEPNRRVISPVTMMSLKVGVINRRIRNKVKSDVKGHDSQTSNYVFINHQEAMEELAKIEKLVKGNSQIVINSMAIKVSEGTSFNFGADDFDKIFKKLTKGMSEDELSGLTATSILL